MATRRMNRLGTLAVALLLILGQTCTPAAFVWRTETVDGGGKNDAGWSPSLALDGADRPHISYNEYIGEGTGALPSLKYAYYDGMGWRIERVRRFGGERTSLVLGRDGHTHIV